MSDADVEPMRIAKLPRNKAGYPIPWFVWRDPDGTADFRVIKPNAIQHAMAFTLCWICGNAMLPRENRVFVIGPMCAVNRVSAEPPSHYDCAVYAATHCPFLARPSMVRRDRHLPAEIAAPGGFSILRNPGVALVWVSRFDAWHAFSDHEGGVLFDVGEPRRVKWYAHGRDATRAEVLASIESGLPILAEAAKQDGVEATMELETMRLRALRLVPAD